MKKSIKTKNNDSQMGQYNGECAMNNGKSKEIVLNPKFQTLSSKLIPPTKTQKLTTKNQSIFNNSYICEA